MIGTGIAALVGMWFALQADIAEAKELPAPVIDRIEYDLKERINSTNNNGYARGCRGNSRPT